MPSCMGRVGMGRVCYGPSLLCAELTRHHITYANYRCHEPERISISEIFGLVRRMLTDANEASLRFATGLIGDRRK